MKKLFKSIFVLAALSTATLFSSCGDKTTDDTVVEAVAPTLTVNDGVKKASASLTVDSINIKVLASADTGRKIKKLTITRAITGQSTNTIKSATYDAKDVIYNHADYIAGQIVIDEADVITYSVTVEDDKGKTTNATYEVTISSMATSGNIILGGPTNTSAPNGEYKFCGIADGFRRYRLGSTGADLARDNSAKVDFVYFWAQGGAVGNAIYSPDYFLTPGVGGWETEISSWPTKNKTLFILTTITSSQFDALQGSTFMSEISALDFSVGTQTKIPNLGVGQVIAFKTSGNKRGFILVASPGSSATTAITLKIKTEL